MDEIEFRGYLLRNGHSESASESIISFVNNFEQYLGARHNGKMLADVHATEIEAFVTWSMENQISPNSTLWALHRYFEFVGDEELRDTTIKLRLREIEKDRIKHQPLKITKIRGVIPGHAKKLATLGIRNTQQLLEIGGTRRGREDLSEQTGISVRTLSELVKIADVARLTDIKGVLGRLLYEAGVDSIGKFAEFTPEELRDLLLKTNKLKRITQTPPTLRDTMTWINQAKRLPKLVED